MIYYHFTEPTLRNGEPIPPIGEWITCKGKIVPRKNGLHASPDAFDALQYAPGNLLHRVELDGDITPHGYPVDKFAARKRMIVASIDATGILRLFARRVALDVIDLWDAPPIVKEYLESGDESKRADASSAASSAASYAASWAASSAAGPAFRAASYAAYGAGSAACAASWAASSASWAASSAAYAAKQKLYRGWFNEMVDTAFALQEVKS
jgi:hypothetical protein